MKSARRILLLIFLVTVAGLILYAFLPKPVPVDIVSVTRGPMRVTVDEDGKTRIKDRYLISAPLAGRLIRIQLKPGDNATANTTMLAVIEPRDPELLDPRAKAEAVARVNAAQSMLDQSIPNLDRAAALMELARKEANKYRELRDRNAGTEKEYDDAMLMERVRTQEYNSAKFAQEIAKFALAQAKAALIRTLPADGPSPDAHFEIRAPCNGRVLRVFQESSAVVQAGTPLLEFGDPSDLEAEIDVLSTDAVKIQRGASVIIDRWGGPQPLQGKVRVVEPSGFTKISALGVEEQRVNIIVDFVDPPDARASLGDGYRIEARIVIQEEASVLRVPSSALFRDGDQWAVFVVENDHAKLRHVKIGMQTALQAQVVDGLDEGTQVIAHPSDRIVAGVAVVER